MLQTNKLYLSDDIYVTIWTRWK